MSEAPGRAAPGGRRARWVAPWNTLRGRLALGAMAGLFAAAIVFAVASSSLIRSETTRTGREEFDRTVVRLSRLISARVERAAKDGRCTTFSTTDLEAFLGRGTRLYASGAEFCPGGPEPYGSLPAAERPPIDRAVLQQQGFQRLDGGFTIAGPNRVTTAAQLRVGGQPFGQIIVSKPTSAVTTEWEDAAPSLLIAAVIGFVPALLLTLLVTARVTRPLETMEDAADQVAAGDLSAMVSTTGTVELDHVGDAFNKMVGRLREREDSTREFLMKVTHDLRTPLTAIRGHAAALADGIVPEAQIPRSLAAIEGEASRLEAMVADLLDLARIDARRFRLDREDIDPTEVLAHAFHAFTADAARREIRLDRDIPALPTIHTDPARLGQIVGNLLENALRWAPDGGLVRLRATSDEERGGIVIEVADNGPGIAPDRRETVFEAFQSEETPDGRTGTGLGLAICRQLARELGGDVVAGAAPEGGALFTVTMPGGRGPDGPVPDSSKSHKSNAV